MKTVDNSQTRKDYFPQMLVSRAERFSDNPLLKYIVGQSRTTIHFREVMDTGQIVLVKLPGNFEDTTELLGSMIIAEILSAALSRKRTTRQEATI